MTLHQLKIFDSVARHLNFTKASTELRISQPSVYLQIKSLEDSCGAKLYTKVGRHIELTVEGERFRDELGRILPRLTKLERGVGRILDSNTSLSIGGSHLLSTAVLAPALVVFKKTHPDVQIFLRTKNSPAIARLVSESEIEIGLITQAVQDRELVLEPYRRENMLIVASNLHLLARKPDLTMAEFAEAPLIIRERHKSASRQLLDQFERQGLRLNILMRCDTANAVKIAVMNGLGLGLLYEDHVRNEIATGQLKIIKIRRLKRALMQSFILYKAATLLSPIAADFLELLRQRNHTMWRNQKPGKASTAALKNDARAFDRSTGI